MESKYDVAIVVATFGSKEWEEEGDFAVSTLKAQTLTPSIVRLHLQHGSLVQARNEAAWMAKLDEAWTDDSWLVFLDADDALDPRFVEAVSAYDGEADILQTAVRGFNYSENGLGVDMEFIDPVPVLHEQKYPLLRQNYLTVGSPIRSEMFFKVGGFDEWPALEDWGLWLKCYNESAVFDELYEAVYLINDRHTRNLDPELDNIARQIRATYNR